MTAENKGANQTVEKALDMIRAAILPGAEDGVSLLSVSAGLMSIAAAYLYFAGYIFTFFFYRDFGVSLEPLDLSSQYFFVHAYSAFMTIPGLVFLTVFMVTAIAYSLQKVRLTILLAAMIGAFPALFYVSYEAAENASGEVRAKPTTTVRFRFKDAEKQPAALAGTDGEVKGTSDLVKLGDSDQLFLLLDTKDRMIVYWKPPNNPALSGFTLPVAVYTIPRSELSWSRILVP